MCASLYNTHIKSQISPTSPASNEHAKEIATRQAPFYPVIASHSVLGRLILELTPESHIMMMKSETACNVLMSAVSVMHGVAVDKIEKG